MSTWHAVEGPQSNDVLFPPYVDDDRRLSERRPVFLSGWLQLDTREIRDVVILDLSFCGARIQTPFIDEQLHLRFSIDLPCAMEEVWIHAEVRWQLSHQAGLFFPYLSLDAQKELQKAALLKTDPYALK